MLTTSGGYLPLIAACYNTPVAFSFSPFIDPPVGAKVLLSNTICLHKTTTFSPGILGNIIAFYISTETASSLSSRCLSFSSLPNAPWSSSLEGRYTSVALPRGKFQNGLEFSLEIWLLLENVFKEYFGTVEFKI